MQWYFYNITRVWSPSWYLNSNFKKSSTILLDGNLQESSDCDRMIGSPWPYAHGCTPFVVKWVLWSKTTLWRASDIRLNIQIHPRTEQVLCLPSASGHILSTIGVSNCKYNCNSDGQLMTVSHSTVRVILLVPGLMMDCCWATQTFDFVCLQNSNHNKQLWQHGYLMSYGQMVCFFQVQMHS